MSILKNYLYICIPDWSTAKTHSYQIHDGDKISQAEVRTCKPSFSLYENNAKSWGIFFWNPLSWMSSNMHGNISGSTKKVRTNQILVNWMLFDWTAPWNKLDESGHFLWHSKMSCQVLTCHTRNRGIKYHVGSCVNQHNSDEAKQLQIQVGEPRLHIQGEET
jgi:hypothetical protein